MRFFSATEDFEVRTLGALPNLLARLEYVGGLLRQEDGWHWGLEFTYGTQPARQAVLENNRSLQLEALRSPLLSLLRPGTNTGHVRQALLQTGEGATRSRESHLRLIADVLSLAAGPPASPAA